MPHRISRRDFCAAAMASSFAAKIVRGDDDAADTSRDVPWLDEIQSPPASVAKAARPLSNLLIDEQGRSITTVGDWRRRKETLLNAWRKFLGPMPADRTRLPKIDVLEEDRDADVLRQLIRYEAEPGESVEAYLLRPARSTGERRPGLVVLHSTVDHSIRQPAGIEGAPEKAFGLAFAKRGFVTISPRNYLWPTNDRIAAQQEADRFLKRHPDSKGMTRMLHDAILATDILAAQPDVDAERIGAVGHSLGAKEVLYLAAFDERIKASVSSEGGIGPTFSNWDAPWYLGPAINEAGFRLDHHELLAAAAPRAFLLIGGNAADGDQSWPYIEAALPVYRLYVERPRVGLFNHKTGHAVPPEAERRIVEWFDAYL